MGCVKIDKMVWYVENLSTVKWHSRRVFRGIRLYLNKKINQKYYSWLCKFS